MPSGILGSRRRSSSEGRASFAWTGGPRQCPLCHDWTDRPLCAPCLSRFAAPAPRCRHCALRLASDGGACPDCSARPMPFVACRCVGDYRFPWDRLIAGLKYRGETSLAAPLAAALVHVLRREAPGVDLVVPVPLGARRLAERGHNQAWEIGRRVARQLGLASDSGVLLRLLDTPRQVGLSREERRANLRGALCVEPARAARLQGRRIALVDDVLTTGATAQACAEVLLRAGAAGVEAWVVARTPAPDAAEAA